MTSALLNRFVRKLHLWLGIAIGVQLGLWLISGLFMTLFPIDTVRGAHLRAEITPMALQVDEALLSPSDLLQRVPSAETIMLQSLGDRLVYRIQAGGETLVRSAVTGEPIGPLSRDQAERIARLNYAGDGFLGGAVFF